MSNPFEEILQELQDIKAELATLKKADAPLIEIIDRAELLRRLNITEPTAIQWGKKGKIPEIRVGSVVRYDWYKVIQSLENHQYGKIFK